MEIDPNFASLLRNLKVDDPPIPPKTWESIPSESGAAPSGDSGRGSQDPIYDLSAVSDGDLVRLATHALQGVKSALVQIEQLSAAFCSSSADRTSHRVSSLWCRSSSANALGKILNSIGHSGLVVFFLQKFVNFYLRASQEVEGESGGKGEVGEDQKDPRFAENLLRLGTGKTDHKNMHPPYSLVNQAFAVAVKKVLEGYLCALNTLLASVRLRRSAKSIDAPASSCTGVGSFVGVIHSEVTVLEVYLHTKELRTYIESLGNICFPVFAGLALDREDLTTDTNLEFHNFPRGADLLTYLYVQLRDADLVHHSLLKFLFVRSCEPYCGFIKSWIYRARINDPYEEFFVEISDNLPNLTDTTSLDGFFLTSIKERDHVSVPCFLKNVCRPLLRAGQQLQVLVKLLDLRNFAVIGGSYIPCDLESLGDILPFWDGSLHDSAFLLNSLTFCKKNIEALMHKRETMYKMTMEKLENFFSKLDVRYQWMSHNVIPFGESFNLLGKRGGAHIPVSLAFDNNLHLFATTDEQGSINMYAGQRDTDVSYTSDESSYEVEQLQSSECSSSYSSEEEMASKDFSKLFYDASQPKDFLLSSLSACYESKSLLPNSCKIERPNSPQIFLHSDCKRAGPYYSSHQDDENEKFSQSSIPVQPRETGYAAMSENLDNGNQSGGCWMLGRLVKNPCYTDIHGGLKQQNSTGNSLQTANRNVETMEKEESVYGEAFIPFGSKLDAIRRIEYMNSSNEPHSLSVHQSWNSHYYYNLSMNPMLTKVALLHTMHSSRYRNPDKTLGFFLPYFDFSSVTDPCKAYARSMFPSLGHGVQVEAPKLVSSGVSAVGMDENCGGSVHDILLNQSDSNPVCLSREANSFSGDSPANISGGAHWAGVLQYSSKVIKHNSLDMSHDSAAVFETPLDVILDKCLLQEILLQYKYVSNFTIKLLEEGFDLRGHFLALRRYYFMELADWADSFVMSLRNQKWSIIDTEQKIAEIQGLLDLALQRSSCETDQYKERLFVYMKEQSAVPQLTYATGVHLFDIMSLGYRVNWPINIIVTEDALKIYADIFSYLVQVKLAVFSLTDVWCCLKALMRSFCHGQHMGSHVMQDFNILMKLRQQINHFVFTLQQYVHSQLADVSWCQFQHSLKHRVKDMLDLEPVHMSYLADALHICFLSAEAKPISIIIKNILQCALDLRLCFIGCDLNPRSNGANTLDLQSSVNFSQVFAIRSMFEKNVKDLYLLFLKSPRHGEFSLCRFWDYLNYNDYYSNSVNKELGYVYL